MTENIENIEDQVENQEQVDTFPRKYVEELRAENAKHRTSVKDAQEQLEQVQRRLFDALVTQAGILADPTDLEFNPELLVEETGVLDAINDLVERKPHLRSRRVSGDIGQGSGGKASQDGAGILGSMLRAAA